MALQYDIGGTIPASSAEVMYRVSVVLIAQGWTVPGSSDGTSFSQSGTNYWVSPTAVKNNGAWIRLRDPSGAGGVEWCLQYSSGGGNAWWFRVSPGGSPFTGTGNGAISATVSPTATFQENVLGSNAAGTSWTGAVDGSYRMNFVSCDSSRGYGFILFLNQTGVNAAAYGGFFYDGLVGPVGDLAPFVVEQHFGSGVIGFLNGVDMYGSNPTAGFGINGWLNYGGAGAIWQELPMLAIYGDNGNYPAFPAQNEGVGQDPVTNADTLIPVMYGCMSNLGLTGLKGFKGISQLLFMNGTQGRAHGQIIGPISGQYYCMVSGTSGGVGTWLAIPWPNSTAPLA